MKLVLWLGKLFKKYRAPARSVPLAIIVAAFLLFLGEIYYQFSREEIEKFDQGHAVHASINRLLQELLNSENGIRGFLLTGNERDLEPYFNAVPLINAELEGLRGKINGSSDLMPDLVKFSQAVSRNLGKIELSLQLRSEESDSAWRAILLNSARMEDMKVVREYSKILIDRTTLDIRRGHEKILQALFILRIGLAVIILISTLSICFYLRQTNLLALQLAQNQAIIEVEQERLDGLVRERTSRLAALATHLQQSQEDERAHLARELHDELGGLLTTAKFDIARLKSSVIRNMPEICARVDHLVEVLDSSIALKRRIIENLRPSSLPNFGLITALEILIGEYSAREDWTIDSSLDATDLPEKIQLTVYRFVQEALINAAKYANASRVSVTMHTYPNNIEVMVNDNGKGFDVKNIEVTYYGLAAIMHRVEAVGGRVTIHSKVECGTVVTAVLPRLSAKV